MCSAKLNILKKMDEGLKELGLLQPVNNKPTSSKLFYFAS